MDSQTKKYVGYALLAMSTAAAGWYVWGLSTIYDRVKVTDLRIQSVGLNFIKLAMTVTNYSTLSVPFTGFSGTIQAQGYILSNVELIVPANQRGIPKGGSMVYTVQSNLNWAQFAALVPDILTKLNAGKWKEVITTIPPTLKGTIYAQNFSADIDMPLV